MLKFWFLLTIFAILVIFQCQGDNFAYHTRPGNSACGPWVDPENEEYIAVNPGLFDSRRGEICSDQGLCFRVKHPSLGERTFRIKDRMIIYRNDLSLKAFRSYTGLLYKDYKNKGHFDGNGEVVSC
uniref:Uncharacterized protein n=1 Tax=Acrobeloides nanus TaxID=290746 RepID=A0A914C1K0_9BILA